MPSPADVAGAVFPLGGKWWVMWNLTQQRQPHATEQDAAAALDLLRRSVVKAE